MGAQGDRAGRLPVDEFLRVPGFESVFAIGDTALAMGEGSPVPGIAPAAKQIGRYAGQFIAAEINKSPDILPFEYRHQGDVATIGRR
jgi:NADH dehydrogenase